MVGSGRGHLTFRQTARKATPRRLEAARLIKGPRQTLNRPRPARPRVGHAGIAITDVRGEELNETPTGAFAATADAASAPFKSPSPSLSFIAHKAHYVLQKEK